MRFRITFLTLITVVGMISLAVAIPKNPATLAKNISDKFQAHLKIAPTQRIGTIDGSTHPELISDDVAYSLLFRLLSNRQTEVEKNRARAYLRQALGYESCGPSDNANIDALMKAAEEYHQRIGVLDRQVKAIKDREWPNPKPQVMELLGKMQQQKEAITSAIISSLPSRLDAEGLKKLRHHIDERVKRKVRITPSPQTPPGGLDWRRRQSTHQH